MAEPGRNEQAPPPVVDDLELKVLRARAAAFRERLANPSIILNPIREFRELISLTRHEFADAVYYSYSRFSGIEDGLSVDVPRPIVELVERVLGAGVEKDLQICWQRFRATFRATARRRADRLLEARLIYGDLDVHPDNDETIDAILATRNRRA